MFLQCIVKVFLIVTRALLGGGQGVLGALMHCYGVLSIRVFLEYFGWQL